MKMSMFSPPSLNPTVQEFQPNISSNNRLGQTTLLPYAQAKSVPLPSQVSSSYSSSQTNSVDVSSRFLPRSSQQTAFALPLHSLTRSGQQTTSALPSHSLQGSSQQTNFALPSDSLTRSIQQTTSALPSHSLQGSCQQTTSALSSHSLPRSSQQTSTVYTGSSQSHLFPSMNQSTTLAVPLHSQPSQPIVSAVPSISPSCVHQATIHDLPVHSPPGSDQAETSVLYQSSQLTACAIPLHSQPSQPIISTVPFISPSCVHQATIHAFSVNSPPRYIQSETSVVSSQSSQPAFAIPLHSLPGLRQSTTSQTAARRSDVTSNSLQESRHALPQDVPDVPTEEVSKLYKRQSLIILKNCFPLVYVKDIKLVLEHYNFKFLPSAYCLLLGFQAAEENCSLRLNDKNKVQMTLYHTTKLQSISVLIDKPTEFKLLRVSRVPANVVTKVEIDEMLLKNVEVFIRENNIC